MSNARFFKVVSGLMAMNGIYLIALGFMFSSFGAGLLGIAFIVPAIIIARNYAGD